jgi:polar amino acid transport system permease protein
MVVVAYLGTLFRAAGITLWVSWLALLLGGAIGITVGLARTSRWIPLRAGAIAYVEGFRSIPLIILLFFVFYGVPLMTHINVPPFTAATIALAAVASANMAEVVRAGIESVGTGQWEAAFASGMAFLAVMRHVIGPQAVRVMLPPSIGVYIGTLKDSSLASIIGYVELTQTGLFVRDVTRNSFLVLSVVASMYFVINYSISMVGAALERRFHIVH